MKKQEKILIFFIFFSLIVLVAGGYLVFKNQFNSMESEFDIYGKIDYAKYERHNLSRENIDTLFENLIEADEKLKIKPNDPSLMVQAAGFKRMLYEYDLALADYLKVIEIKPDFGPAYAEIAELYVYPFSRYEEAVEYYKKAIQFAPYRTDYYRWLADLYVSKFPDKKSGIEELMLDGAEANKEDENRLIDFYSYLITFFRQEGDLEKAVDYTKKCIGLSPDSENLKNTLKELEAELSSVK